MTKQQREDHERTIEFFMANPARSQLLLELDELLEHAKKKRCFPETIQLLEQAIAVQEIGERARATAQHQIEAGIWQESVTNPASQIRKAKEIP